MKIETIYLQAFKGFLKEECISLKRRNMLLFGENGSGKSSLYNALHYSLQGNTHIFEAPFDTVNHIRNFNAEDAQSSYIRFEFDNEDTFYFGDGRNVDFETANTGEMLQTMKEAYQNSELVSYKLLYSFYHFRADENIDLFPIFRHEFFPLWLNTSNELYSNWIEALERELKAMEANGVKKRDSAYKSDFKLKIADFNDEFEKMLISLTPQMNEWYQNLRDNRESHLKISFDLSAKLSVKDFELVYPVINLHLEVRGKTDTIRPHNYLNESRLTMFALAIRLAVFEKRLATSELKILVLDDLLLSLDMGNRMKVFAIFLQNEKFKDFQKFIFTHDESLYNVLKEKTLSRDWVAYKMYEDSNLKSPKIELDEDDFHKAKRFFEEREYDACANYLRKESEKILKLFLDPDLKRLEKDFVGLQDLIQSASNKVKEEDLAKFEANFRQALSDAEKEELKDIMRDFNSSPDVLNIPRGKIRGIIRKLILFFMDMQELSDNRKEILSEMQTIKNRILNPRSHSQISNVAPLYHEELEKAIKLLEKLKEVLNQ